MQASKKRHLGKRFRYYQSAIDVDIVKKVQNFGKLKASYIIFIVTYDPYGKGWYLYPFDMVCQWDPSIRMNDAASWYVLNTKGKTDAKGHEVSDDVKELLKLNTITTIRLVISNHPDWDDDDVAEEVLDLEDEY